MAEEHDILRTKLANERTFLAYIRTSLTFLAVGLTFVRFFGHIVIETLGWVMIPVGVFIMIKGIISFRKVNRSMDK
jgi:putative membrane protein